MPNFKGFLEGNEVEESVRGTHLSASESSSEDVSESQSSWRCHRMPKSQEETVGILSHGHSKFQESNGPLLLRGLAVTFLQGQLWIDVWDLTLAGGDSGGMQPRKRCALTKEKLSYLHICPGGYHGFQSGVRQKNKK